MRPTPLKLRGAGKLVIIAVLLLPISLFAYVSPGKPAGFVNDFAHILKPETVLTLEQNLKAFESSKKSEIAVVTVPTIGKDETLETYATKLFEEWKIGKKGADNGLLLLVSRDDKQVRIEVGYGLEGDVTDIESGRIISEVMIPAFKNGDYDAGVIGAVDRIESDILHGGSVATSTPSSSPGINIWVLLIFVIIWIILARRGIWVVGGMGGLGGSGRGGGGFGGFGGGRSGGGGASGSW